MATIDTIGLNRNDYVRESRVLIGTLEITPETTSGDVYLVGSIPAGSIVTDVHTVVDVAFDGTTPTIDVGVTGNAAYYANDLDVTSTGMTTSAASDAYYVNGTVLSITPTISGATKGKVRVYVTYSSTIFTGAYSTEQ